MKKLLYGATTLYQEICPECREKNLSTDENFTCTYCGYNYNNQNKNIKTEIRCTHKKRKHHISKEIRENIRSSQDNKCLICGKEFGSSVIHRNKLKTLKMVIDHFVPVTFMNIHREDNFIGLCYLCNIIKYNRNFNNLDEAKDYVLKNIRGKIKVGSLIYL